MEGLFIMIIKNMKCNRAKMKGNVGIEEVAASLDPKRLESFWLHLILYHLEKCRKR